jgi:outer membrane lipoprotein-sorting protein
MWFSGLEGASSNSLKMAFNRTIWRQLSEELNSIQTQRFNVYTASESEFPVSLELIMKTIIIATLLGLFLSTPALASSADFAQQMRSHSSNTASGYVYVNRLDAPASNNPVSANTSAAERLSSQL